MSDNLEREAFKLARRNLDRANIGTNLTTDRYNEAKRARLEMENSTIGYALLREARRKKTGADIRLAEAQDAFDEARLAYPEGNDAPIAKDQKDTPISKAGFANWFEKQTL